MSNISQATVRLFVIFFTLVFSASTLAVEEVAKPSPARFLEAVVMKGKEVPALLNKPVADYSLMAVHKGKLSAIPYQFDDKNIRGLTYVEGGILAVDGKVGVLEEKDELVFMYKDLGIKADESTRTLSTGTVVSELEITEKGSSRYAYLVQGNPERSDKSYTHYDMKTGLLETEYYSLQLDPENLLLWSDWNVKGFEATPSAPNVLDTMKVRVKAKLGFIGATLHGGLIPVKMLATKNGPVRSIIEADASISILGIDLAKAGLSTTFTAQTIEYPIFAALPKAAGVLSTLKIDVTLDYVDFEGSRYRTALGPKEPMITGTKEAAKLRDKYTMDLDHPWVTISTGKDWDMFFFFFHEENFRPSLSAVYKDGKAGDKADKPERFKGSNSEIGVNLDDVPVGLETSLHFNLYFGPDLWQGNNPEAAAADILNPAKVIVNSTLIGNL